LTITKLREIKIVLHRNFRGKIKNVTIEKTASGKYFASIFVDNQQVEQKKVDDRFARNLKSILSANQEKFLAQRQGAPLSTAKR